MREISDLRHQESCRFSVLTPNQKGLDNALQSGAREVVVFASATEAFSRKNQNCSVEQALETARQVVQQAKQHSLWVRGVVSCIFGDPYSGPTPPQDVVKVVKAFLDMGCDEVGLGDTLGIGTPRKTQALLELLLRDVPASKLTGHFHDTYGQAVANIVRAYDLGVRIFDSSVAGLGGCPYAPGAKGNAATEDVVYTFETSGISTGIDLDKISLVGSWISGQLRVPNNSRAGAALAAKQQSVSTTTVSANSDTRKEPQTTTQARQWSVETRHEGFTVARAGNSVKITLTRPRNGNAMTTDMLVSLTEAFERLAEDPMTFHIVLTAEGKYFCTGMDLTGDSRDDSAAYHDKIVRLFRAIDDAPQITIAAVQGPAYGGGVGLGFVCDVRLAAKSAKWKLAEVKLGMTPAIISKYMSREWGIPFFREAMLSGRDVGTQELQRLGVIHGIADHPKQLDNMIDNYLDQLKSSAPRAAATCKQLVRNSFTGPGSQAQDLFIRETFGNMLMSGGEGQHGIKKFQQKIKTVDWPAFHRDSRGTKL
ncbi:Hydroxymethylglutaryl-CoA lyase, mitochondrial [Cyphellophora attinorum]|uniref:hydroxymethylglutaryl-CoA lyase n=1 Tax=Cyphellophora attinorum TaxID=1664694 RepID=A0A0N1HCX0_9EURO|nr:Hydroxymethylglutaryl-CoA lyase, mitochondrial [Phialophora attinorum]KPI41890.1 Hydroxymethylglutaryl-CoA lyase, mitochondrial [Phialophora attinorum]